MHCNVAVTADGQLRVSYGISHAAQLFQVAKATLVTASGAVPLAHAAMPYEWIHPLKGTPGAHPSFVLQFDPVAEGRGELTFSSEGIAVHAQGEILVPLA